MTDFRSPSAPFPEPEGFHNPPMMAIGDSLFNGVRSLSITRQFADESLPAMVAGTRGWRFTTPDYPEPVLLNLEEELRRYSSITGFLRDFPGFIQRIKDNALRWCDRAPSETLTFDNLSIGGATVETLIEVSHATAVQRRDELVQRLQRARTLIDLIRGNVDYAHQMINSAYVLNPSNHPAFARFRPIDWVALRRPKRLLISCGSNHGLITLSTGRDLEVGKTTLWNSLERHRSLARMLACLPPEVSQVYVTTLMPISLIGNLEPAYENLPSDPAGISDAETLSNIVRPEPPGEGNYFRNYIKAFSSQSRPVSGAEIRDIDDFIGTVNERLHDIYTRELGESRQVIMVDPAEMRQTMDGKHDRNLRLVIRRREYSNEMLATVPILRWRRRGGVFGLDNHHLTRLGYTIYANFILEKMAEFEGVTPVPKIPLDPRQDTLLTDIPAIWFRLTALAPILRSLGGLSRPGAGVRREGNLVLGALVQAMLGGVEPQTLVASLEQEARDLGVSLR